MISVAMAVYNGANYIEEQLDSILNQSRAVDEIVIVDDGSSDGSRDILLRFKQKYPIIRLFFNENNLGYLKNFTKAASLTRGDIIFFCDQDDCWYQNKVETMIHTMEK
ncbi:glycosyltransferase, partial [Faecalibaculum rodentium]